MGQPGHRDKIAPAQYLCGLQAVPVLSRLFWDWDKKWDNAYENLTESLQKAYTYVSRNVSRLGTVWEHFLVYRPLQVKIFNIDYGARGQNWYGLANLLPVDINTAHLTTSLDV